MLNNEERPFRLKPLERYLTFADLKRMNVVQSRTTLIKWIREAGFPPGHLLAGSRRVFPAHEVEAWINKSSKTLRQRGAK